MNLKRCSSRAIKRIYRFWISASLDFGLVNAIIRSSRVQLFVAARAADQPVFVLGTSWR